MSIAKVLLAHYNIMCVGGLDDTLYACGGQNISNGDRIFQAATACMKYSSPGDKVFHHRV